MCVNQWFFLWAIFAKNFVTKKKIKEKIGDTFPCFFFFFGYKTFRQEKKFFRELKNRQIFHKSLQFACLQHE